MAGVVLKERPTVNDQHLEQHRLLTDTHSQNSDQTCESITIGIEMPIPIPDLELESCLVSSIWNWNQ